VITLHLFLYGKSGVGKTTLINQALKDCGLTPATGFKTYKRNDKVYLDQANAPLPAEDNRHWVATCGITGIRHSNPAVFDALADECLSNITPGSTVLMDELGFLELEAHHFQNRVLQALEQPCQVIGVIKEKPNPFLDCVRRHPLVRTVAVDESNRSEVLNLVKSFLRQQPLTARLGLLADNPDHSDLISDNRSHPKNAGKVISVIGAGGKTSLIYMLARELAAAGHSVIITATTKMYWPQKHQAPKTVVLKPVGTGGNEQSCLDQAWPKQVRRALAESPVVTVGTPETAAKKPAAPAGTDHTHQKFTFPVDKIAELALLADYVLVEADGSKGLPCKAWSAYEPVIPKETDVLLQLAGLTSLGQPLDKVCHRPELAAELLGCDLGQILQPSHLAALASQLQNRRQAELSEMQHWFLLNQADALADQPDSFSFIEKPPAPALLTARLLRQKTGLPVMLTALQSAVPVLYTLDT
jgi:probable selenium-dependent hydroxylase accessory protein YqeC